jgi:endonuclease YncB( thermonuclease family)
MRRLPALLALFLFAAPSFVADYSARVVGISDGDTITVLTAEKKQVKIRLHGIDAPEAGQPFGTRAKQLASQLAFGKTVTIKERDKDRYGRTVADVILPDGRSMNHEMVREGMAWRYRRYAPNDKELSRLETEAKTAHKGLWSDPDPVPPWDWRKGVGVPQTTGVVANRKSHVYHKPSCKGVASMKESNKETFDSAEAAEKAGYHKAGDCWK